MWREGRNARRFGALIERIGADLVYVNSVVSYAAVRAARQWRRPCVWHLRELLATEGGEMKVPAILQPWLRRRLRGSDSELVCISNSVAVSLLGAAEYATAVVPNAVDSSYLSSTISKHEARDRLGLPRDSPLVGVPGTLREVKGHRFLFGAIPRIVERYPTCVFPISGALTSSYSERVLEQARETGTGEKCVFLGDVSDMRTFYAACDVICVPSRSEPFGRTVIEAFACARPVVAASVGGIRETVRHGENGLLVEYGDEDALATTILAVLEDPERGGRLVASAVGDVREKYSEVGYRERILSVVATATARRE